MATIKLEILLDSKEQNDVNAFANLMNAFSGTPAVQVIQSGDSFPTEVQVIRSGDNFPAKAESQKAEEAQAEQKSETLSHDYSEEEMMDMPNIDLKQYATDLGIDWAKADGKNTNRKLANLVLEFRAGGTETAEESPADQEAAEETTETEAAEETDSEAQEVTQADLKNALTEKVEDHRDAIVAEFAKFGATKISNLPEEHYAAMYNFMKAL